MPWFFEVSIQQTSELMPNNIDVVLVPGVRQDCPSGGDRHPQEQPLPDLLPGAAGALQVGHRGGVARDHARLHQQTRSQVRPQVR